MRTQRPTFNAVYQFDPSLPFADRSGRWRRKRARLVGSAIRAITSRGPAVTITEMRLRMGLSADDLVEFFDDEGGLQIAISDYARASLIQALMPVPGRRSSIESLSGSLALGLAKWLKANRALAEYSTRHFDYLGGPLDDLALELRDRCIEVLQQILEPHDLAAAELWVLAELIVESGEQFARRAIGTHPFVPCWLAVTEEGRLEPDEFAQRVIALIVGRGALCGVEIDAAARL